MLFRSVQHPAGRKHEHVRLFGYRSLDPAHKVVEVVISVADAVDLISLASTEHEFPEVEVDDRAWVYCLNSGDVKVVHLKDEEPKP